MNDSHQDDRLYLNGVEQQVIWMISYGERPEVVSLWIALISRASDGRKVGEGVKSRPYIRGELVPLHGAVSGN